MSQFNAPISIRLFQYDYVLGWVNHRKQKINTYSVLLGYEVAPLLNPLR